MTNEASSCIKEREKETKEIVCEMCLQQQKIPYPRRHAGYKQRHDTTTYSKNPAGGKTPTSLVGGMAERGADALLVVVSWAIGAKAQAEDTTPARVRSFIIMVVGGQASCR